MPAGMATPIEWQASMQVHALTGRASVGRSALRQAPKPTETRDLPLCEDVERPTKGVPAPVEVLASALLHPGQQLGHVGILGVRVGVSRRRAPLEGLVAVPLVAGAHQCEPRDEPLGLAGLDVLGVTAELVARHARPGQVLRRGLLLPERLADERRSHPAASPAPGSEASDGARRTSSWRPGRKRGRTPRRGMVVGAIHLEDLELGRGDPPGGGRPKLRGAERRDVDRDAADAPARRPTEPLGDADMNSPLPDPTSSTRGSRPRSSNPMSSSSFSTLVGLHRT